MTLIFQNQAPSAAHDILAITCAHVVGDMTTPHPVSPYFWSTCCPDQAPIGEVLISTTIQAGRVEFDIAAATVSPTAAEKCPIAICRTRRGSSLVGFMPESRLRAGPVLSCEFGTSNLPSATVDGFAGEVTMLVSGREVSVSNAYLVRCTVAHGDSGGLLHADGLAAGILFGLSPLGWGWFHHLESAVRFLGSLDARCPISVF